jgi:hypothetical protein
MQPAGLPGRTTGRGDATTPYPSTCRGTPFTRRTSIIGTRARPHEHGTCAQKGRVTRPVSHALQTAPQTRKCRPKPHLTPARSFRDEKRMVDYSAAVSAANDANDVRLMSAALQN